MLGSPRTGCPDPRPASKGGICVTIARPPAPCPPKLHPREGGTDKGSGAVCLSPDQQGHLSLQPTRRSSGAEVTQDLRLRILRAAAAAVAKARDARGSTTREESRHRVNRDSSPLFFGTLPEPCPGRHPPPLKKSDRRPHPGAQPKNPTRPRSATRILAFWFGC